MNITMHASSFRSRMQAVLQGQRPASLPFITRIDFWHRHHLHRNTVPDEFKGLSTLEVSKALGIGRQANLSPGAFRYRNLEVRIRFNKELIYHQTDPLLDLFPNVCDLIPTDRPGISEIELITSRGVLTMRYVMNEEMVDAGATAPLILKHPVCAPEDYRTYAYILENSEYVPQFERFSSAQAEIGEHGWLVPLLNRSPFQSLLLEVIGEIPLFYALHDDLPAVEHLYRLIDEQTREQLKQLEGLAVPYIEFNDNVEGSMTNPRLFKKYCLPSYQAYAGILHAQGKKMGAHTDGNLKPLASLMPGCGLDVCESFTPHPLTPLTIEDAWQTWQNGPLIWGGIPSYYLEPRASQSELEEYIERLLALVGNGLMIFGVVDAVMADNDIERVRWIAQRLN